MKTIRQSKLTAILLCLLLCTMIVPMIAFAVDDGNATLTVEYIHSNVKFDIYRVATPSETGYTTTEDFSGYAVSFDLSTNEEWRTLASTLEAYIARDSLTPIASGITDINGTVSFEQLISGLYLITGAIDIEENHIYTPTPFLVAVTNGAITATVKYNCKYNGDTQADYTVEKLWKDTNHTKNRPINVTVQLLKDGSVYDTVVLNAANSWKYIWNYLDTKYHWQIVEVVQL